MLRPKWTRIKPYDERYDDTFYADALVRPNTVLTFTPVTLDAFLEHGSEPATANESHADGR
jgi:hypothetical protein